ncbi:hypothetical protein OIDMADRAFT_190292 [Oidiodendron maius Zn]|uniref:NAD-dependent 15-hydroxyprostaglandin dehydrogenase n=1 Tax=Oidiodendron maius (strain Zn) TaxID=913774 RepID=A0A0C3HTC3_OIDMZ|nr:hypothetical protein OIDMADRAFT_190292 [Oidiodendron maius Zn]
MAFSVKGKTAIITGAGSGINLSFASLLLSNGCNVLFADLKLRPEAEAVVNEFSNPTNADHGEAIFQETDVTEWKQLELMFSVAEARYGAIDIVVPGAGVYEPNWSSFWHPPGTAESTDPIDGNHYKMLDINITHPIRVTQLAVAHFLKRKQPGSIVHISSVAGQRSSSPTPLYNASKHAISSFVRSLARLEKRFRIRVTAVAPGLIKTPLWTESPEKLKNLSEADGDEWATPEEVALAMLDLIEKDECAAGKITGGTILEVGKDQTRLVAEVNDPGPSGRGHTARGIPKVAEGILDAMAVDGWGIPNN